MTRLTLPLLIVAAIVSGCGRSGDSGWNPLSWGGRPAPSTSLAPEEGYVTQIDERPAIPQILSAEWEPLSEGRLLVVRGFAPVKGYHSAELVSVRPQPGNRMTPDADGVLRLRFVAAPPAANSAAATLPANPTTDQIVVAMPLSFLQLNKIYAIEIAGATQVVKLSR
ncbi:hypothetical protein [Paracoccus sp. JM45]|uniref:hypothetical protein n=1 Tax=Paracoccus sp. JM45 TaxID=2283626 RepID=UPI000E6CEFDA|nr:hypothetical protein [Paracoccus sp. JM45]RJE79230.1 hypothetical protein DWB67_13605 [Paracoccus sp. JM45]